MDRPRCGRCKGPLDIWHDPESGIGLVCNNLADRPTPAQTDEQFWERWESLPGDDVVKLLRDLGQ